MEGSVSSQQQLDDMFNSGTISREEYDRLKAALREQRRREETSGKTPSGRRGRLQKKRGNQVIGGVCAGLAEYFNLDPVLVRVLAVALLVFALPFTLIAYVALYFALPWDAQEEAAGGWKFPWVFASIVGFFWLVIVAGLLYGGPVMENIYQQLGGELPSMTQLAVTAAELLQMFAIIAIPLSLLLVALLVVVYIMISRPGIRRAFGSLVTAFFLFILLFFVIAFSLPILSVKDVIK